MAKATRKKTQPTSFKGVASQKGTKNLSAYMNNDSFKFKKEKSSPNRRERRFSIANLSSEEESGDDSDDSDSSLTVVSDNVSDKSSIMFNEDDSYYESLGKGKGKSVRGKNIGQGKTLKSYGKKYKKSYDQEEEEEEDDDEEEEEGDDEEEDSNSSSDDDDRNSSDSSSDSDVDFVKLQAHKKLRALKHHPEHKENDNQKKRRSSGSVSRPKFGRRRSEAAYPDDINFTFEFDDKYNENAISDDDDNDDDNNDNNNDNNTNNNLSHDNSQQFDDSNDDEEEEEEEEEDDEEDEEDEEEDDDEGNNEDDDPDNDGYDKENDYNIFPSNSHSQIQDDQEEEDIGEEITVPTKDHNELELDFNHQMFPVPKLNDDDLNSDEDYEFDDNELLATLQADNDLEKFDKPDALIGRKSSITSADDAEHEEEDENVFLKEEEKFLVNEFENNGFDDDKNQSNTKPKQPIKSSGYISSEDEALEEDDYHDMVDFTIGFDEEDDFDKSNYSPSHKGQKPKKVKYRGGKPNSSDDDDDSYLWNYFFSSDNDSNSEDDGNENHGKRKFNKTAPGFSDDKAITTHNYIHDLEPSDQEYDSGESTDVDQNIPNSNVSQQGSQKAKEVLSSKTADYRPPVLGTWVAVESKPFGIIDGLSTRTLAGAYGNNQDVSARNRPRRSVASTPTSSSYNDDSALGLDELLNMSDMDYDDTNDVKIWRDFNNQKRRVPLGAFRNKSLLQNSINEPQDSSVIASNADYDQISKSNTDFNQRRSSLSRRRSSSNHGASFGSKQKRRRASRAEAVTEGYRPTKSGLFNEQALADVEEAFADDNDIMALVKEL